MTPAARYAAAIAVLDQILAGDPAEKALLAWSRSSRFAGSKDRAAVRDHVFNVLRNKRSFGRYGGAETGRALVVGLLRQAGVDVESVFCGEGYAPLKLSAKERATFEIPVSLTDAERANLPDDVWSLWLDSLEGQALECAMAANQRGPITLRVNLKKSSQAAVIAGLSSQGIAAEPHPNCPTAVLVTRGERRLATTGEYLSGHFEFQDASSQLAMQSLKLSKVARVLDYCAGGGGKSLALWDMFEAKLTAHDAEPERMKDLGPRADRAGAEVLRARTEADLSNEGYKVVLVDAPCSGSGTWRRTPDQKWRMTLEEIKDFSDRQFDILMQAATFVEAEGTLVYATCSVFRQENEEVVARFMNASSMFKLHAQNRFDITEHQDGFFLAQLKRV